MIYTLIIAITVAGLLFLSANIIKDGIQFRNYKKVIITAILTLLAFGIGYYGLVLVLSGV